MTLREAIEIADKMVVNGFDETTKTAWVNEFEAKVQNEVLDSTLYDGGCDMHTPNNIRIRLRAGYIWESEYTGNITATDHTITLEGVIAANDYGQLILSNCDISGTYNVVAVNDGEFIVEEELTDFTGTAKAVFTNKNTELLLCGGWEKLYYEWLIAKVDFANRDYDLYADTSAQFNSDWRDFVKWYCYNYVDNKGGCGITQFVSAAVAIPTYDGDYSVSPDFIGRTLFTKNKLMIDSVTVEPIEIQRTSNPQGGKTVYIGGSIND